MDKRKNLSIANNLALCFIAIISIVIAIGTSALFYYFDRYVDVAGMTPYYQFVKQGINILFTFSVLALMMHIQYKILGKTLLSRMDMKKNKVIKQVAYWIISVIIGIMVLYIFDTFIDKFDKYFLFMLLAIVEICDIVSDYMIDEFDVNNEEVSLSYLIFAVMIAGCCYVVFNFSGILIEGKILQGYNSTKQFYYITKNILSKVESNNIVELKEYVNKINSLKDNNELIEEYATWINSLPDVINDEQLIQLRSNLSRICSDTDETKITQDYNAEKEELKKALTIEGLLIFLISLITFVMSCQIKKMIKESNVKKKIKKSVKQVAKEIKVEPKKEETKKVAETELKKEIKKSSVKKVEKNIDKKEVKKTVKKVDPKGKK